MAEEEVKETEEVEESEEEIPDSMPAQKIEAQVAEEAVEEAEEDLVSKSSSKAKLIFAGVALFALGVVLGCFWMTWNV